MDKSEELAELESRCQIAAKEFKHFCGDALYNISSQSRDFSGLVRYLWVNLDPTGITQTNYRCQMTDLSKFLEELTDIASINKISSAIRMGVACVHPRGFEKAFIQLPYGKIRPDHALEYFVLTNQSPLPGTIRIVLKAMQDSQIIPHATRYLTKLITEEQHHKENQAREKLGPNVAKLDFRQFSPPRFLGK